MLNLTRDNTQLLINDIWQLNTERVDECIVAKLPQSTTVLPRLRKVPGPKALTKWEKFAQEKGISKKKKDKKVYDQTLDVSFYLVVCMYVHTQISISRNNSALHNDVTVFYHPICKKYSMFFLQAKKMHRQLTKI